MCCQLKQGPSNSVCCCLVARRKEDAGIDSNGGGVNGPASLRVPETTQASPKGRVTLRLRASGQNPSCRGVIFLQRQSPFCIK